MSQTALDFRGRDALLAVVEEAYAQPDGESLTHTLRDGLCRLIKEKAVSLPDCVFEPVEGHYARRELYACPERGTTIVAMTWAPAQGTPIHDHCGLWCVEGVWQGQLEITRYELEEEDGDRALHPLRNPARGHRQRRQPVAAARIPHHPQSLRGPHRDLPARVPEGDGDLRHLRAAGRRLVPARVEGLVPGPDSLRRVSAAQRCAW
jgi:hypothetical protein